MQRSHFLRGLGAAAMLAGVGQRTLAQAQAYPSRPIRLILPIGAGGVADGMVRLLGNKISPSLGQPFVLENRPGAGGNIGMEAVARAAPDGYTLLVNGPSSAINSTLYKKLSFDPAKDITTVAMIALAPFAVFVSGTLPVKTIGEFIAYAKRQPGKLNFASVGAGTAGHLSAVMFAAAAGLDMVHTPYKSIQSAVPDIVSGQVHLVFNAYPPLAALVPDGKLKFLGFSSAKRLAGYPDAPTLAESGLPGFETGGWYLIGAPAGTPLEIQQKLNSEFVRALRDPEVAAGIVKLGFDPLPLNLEESKRYFASEVEKWSKAVKASGAGAE